MRSEKKRVVLIGTGGRSNAYLMHGAKGQMVIAGIADPNVENRRTFLGLNSLVGLVPQFADWREMLDVIPDIDGAIVTTPNYLHTEPAVACMKRGYALALEKPIAENAANCRKLLAAKREYEARVLIGFVMRSTPFYLQAKAWIDEGRIGEIVSIHADEIPHVLTTSVMFRSDWRRFKSTSGGSLLEKCCHDMDMLCWLAGGFPQRVNSFAGVKNLGPRADVPQRCDVCHIQDECVYYLPPAEYGHSDMVKQSNDGLLYKFTRDNSACIYNNGHDIYDHQNVQLQFDNGVLATLVLDFSGTGKICGRTLKVLGTRGAIYGKLEDNEIFLHNNRTDSVESVALRDDGSGHGGSNRGHADTFVRLMEEPQHQPLASLEAGYLSAMLCFAADQSAMEARQIDVSGLSEPDCRSHGTYMSQRANGHRS